MAYSFVADVFQVLCSYTSDVFRDDTKFVIAFYIKLLSSFFFAVTNLYIVCLKLDD